MEHHDPGTVTGANENEKRAVLAPNVHDGLPIEESPRTATGRLQRAWKSFERQLVAYNLEARGIQRVEPDERQDLRALGYSQVAIMWFSVNLAANNITLGMLGPAVFALGFVDSALLSVFGALVGSMVVAYIATFGPKSGNRTMIFSRYSMGWWPSKIVVVLNIIVLLGYGMIDCVVAGQILSAVSGNTMSVVVGIIIVAIIAWAITTFGYQIFHYYERWAWLPQLIVLCILAGVAGPQFNIAAKSHGDENPDTISGNRISFFGLTLAAAITYGGGAADYFVYYPEHASSLRIFGMTLFGLLCSFTFAFVLGIGLACGMLANADWEAAYGISQGALIVEAYRPLGAFGSFCGVVVALGLVANLIVPTYSSGIDAQILGRWAGAVPRVIWNTVGVIIYTVCALAGRAHLAEIFTNFLALMGYWVSIWIAIVLEEHLIFRRKTGWNWDVWNQQKKLPLGLAAFVAFVVGWVGAILCMAQVWYYGPIALLVGTYGADMGNYVGFAWAALVYPPLRMLELKKFGRLANSPSDAEEELISLAEDITQSFASSSAISASDMAGDRRESTHRDSFSDLTGLMKAKKPYKPVPPVMPRPSVSTSNKAMKFASRVGSDSSILSPLAQPYRVGGSVAAFLQDQARSPPAAEVQTPNSYNQDDLHRLEWMLQELENTPVQGYNEADVKVQSLNSDMVSLLPTTEPAYRGPVGPPTPAPSVKVALPDEPVVRLTMHAWDAIGRDLENLKEEKRDLEIKIARLGKQKAIDPIDDYKSELEDQIGKLRYQNESNKTQKATMARTLSEKDMQIKLLQLDLDGVRERLETTASLSKELANVAAERDHLQATLRNDRTGHSQLISGMAVDKEQALRQANEGDEHKCLARQRLDQLCQREKQLQAIKEKYTAEQIKVIDLQDRIEDLQDKLAQVGDLQAQLSDKTSTCDRLRNKLKQQERQLEDMVGRLKRASGDHALRGAAHLVKPDKGTKFSHLVLGCSECYTKNISCDNKARCRPCWRATRRVRGGVAA
ncbi:NCS1 nucleoside transporter [Stagonosporopsis vannaccii]|nr:NCS1 nucleoside transporter [Stagonosporopsis vannaccii]